MNVQATPVNVPKKLCTDLTKKGTPCTNKALDGTDKCVAHSSDLVKMEHGFGGKGIAQAGGRPKKPKASEVELELIEQNIIIVQQPYWRTLGYELKKRGNGLKLVPLPGGGAKIYGESKDGDIRFTTVDDLAAQIKAAEALKDRAFGKPRQMREVKVDSRSILATVDITDQETRDTIAKLLRGRPAALPAAGDAGP